MTTALLPHAFTATPTLPSPAVGGPNEAETHIDGRQEAEIQLAIEEAERVRLERLERRWQRERPVRWSLRVWVRRKSASP